MPRRFQSFRLWAIVTLVAVTGIAAMAFGGDGAKPQLQRAWSQSAAL